MVSGLTKACSSHRPAPPTRQARVRVSAARLRRGPSGAPRVRAIRASMVRSTRQLIAAAAPSDQGDADRRGRQSAGGRREAGVRRPGEEHADHRGEHDQAVDPRLALGAHVLVERGCGAFRRRPQGRSRSRFCQTGAQPLVGCGARLKKRFGGMTAMPLSSTSPAAPRPPAGWRGRPGLAASRD
jgi:hypothetical protein